MLSRASDIHGNGPGEVGSTSYKETQHILDALTVKSKSGKRYRPFAGSVAYCPRQNWFHANVGASEGVVPATLTLYQGLGNGVEEKIVKGLEAHGWLLGTQVSLPNPPPSFKINVGGYIDAVAFGADEKVTAYEIKTCSSLPSSPKLNHLSQAMTYAVLGGIDRVVVVYVGRQVQAFPDPSPLVKSFLLDVPALLHEYASTIVLSCHALSGREAPARPATFRKSVECQYCDFAAKCWGDEPLTFSPRKQAEMQAEAEKTAQELIALRPAFYASLLASCKNSCPAGNVTILEKHLREANEAAEKLYTQH